MTMRSVLFLLIFVTTSRSSEISIPAFGRFQELGKLYNAMKGQFVYYSIFDSALNESMVTRANISSFYKSGIQNITTFSEKCEMLQLKTETCVSILSAGKFQVGGSASYLEQDLVSENEVELAFHARVLTVREDLESTEIIKKLNSNFLTILKWSDPTHVLTGISYGAEVIVSSTEPFGSYFSADFIPKDGIFSGNLFQRFQNESNILKALTGGRGSPKIYHLTPIAELTSTNQTDEPPCNRSEISSQMQTFMTMFDRIEKHEKKIDVYKDALRQPYVPYEIFKTKLDSHKWKFIHEAYSYKDAANTFIVQSRNPCSKIKNNTELSDAEEKLDSMLSEFDFENLNEKKLLYESFVKITYLHTELHI